MSPPSIAPAAPPYHIDALCTAPSLPPSIRRVDSVQSSSETARPLVCLVLSELRRSSFTKLTYDSPALRLKRRS